MSVGIGAWPFSWYDFTDIGVRFLRSEPFQTRPPSRIESETRFGV